MQTQPINNVNFKALLIQDGNYNKEQQDAIQKIREQNIGKLEERGYDVLVKPALYSDIDIETYLTPRGAKSHRRYVGYHMDFNSDDLCDNIDKEISKQEKARKNGKLILLLLWGLAFAGAFFTSKSCSGPKSHSENKKATTEIINTIASSLK